MWQIELIMRFLLFGFVMCTILAAAYVQSEKRSVMKRTSNKTHCPTLDLHPAQMHAKKTPRFPLEALHTKTYGTEKWMSKFEVYAK